MQVFTPGATKSGTDYEETCYVTTRKNVRNNNRTYTSTAVSGDLIDFRAMNAPSISPSAYATEMRRAGGYKTTAIPYLPGEASADSTYYLTARSNPNNLNSSFRIVGQWTP